MSEQYRFMRYYLPGSLFFTYLLILIILNLSPNTIKSLQDNWGQIGGIILGLLGASPIAGYIIYSVYNEYDYERLSKKNRPALEYIENLDFIEDKTRCKHYQDQLRCFLQKKEFLDLIYHTTLIKSKEDNLKIGPEILQTLKNHLSNFATRRVSGLWVPFFSFLFLFPTAILLGIFDVSFTIRLPYTIGMFLVILIISFVLLHGHKRVLYEAYTLEVYMIRAKHEEVEELLKRLFEISTET
ncbi:MAG: hypothetical protein NWE91_02740 [Candidatus Bathyarchaeota archaeon]|nr:hypothetical protein [Candidatus Bathyarchaeota archaeon]